MHTCGEVFINEHRFEARDCVRPFGLSPGRLYSAARTVGSLNTATEHLRIVIKAKESAKDFPGEEFYVASPARAAEKSRPSFELKWAEVDENERQLCLTF